MTDLHAEFVRLHGIHRVLHEALPIVTACPGVVAVWAENPRGRNWEPRFEMPNGLSCYRAGTEEKFRRFLGDWRTWHPKNDAVSYPGAIRFARVEVEEWPTMRAEVASFLRQRTRIDVAWHIYGCGVNSIGFSGYEAIIETYILGRECDRDAIQRGLWLPREFLVFGDEPAPVPFEQLAVDMRAVCDCCGAEAAHGAHGNWFARYLAGLMYHHCPKCCQFGTEEFVRSARDLRVRATHRPDTGLSRQIARFDTDKGEVVFVDGIKQPLVAPKPSPTEERRAALVKQHLAYLSTPTVELVKGLKR